MRPHELAVKRGIKLRRPTSDSEAAAVDLITLLEENWWDITILQRESRLAQSMCIDLCELRHQTHLYFSIGWYPSSIPHSCLSGST